MKGLEMYKMNLDHVVLQENKKIFRTQINKQTKPKNLTMFVSMSKEYRIQLKSSQLSKLEKFEQQIKYYYIITQSKKGICMRSC